MKSSELVLFRDICDNLDSTLYQTLQNPNSDFIEEVESGIRFNDFSSNGLEYDFEDMEEKLDVILRYYQRMALFFTKYYFDKKYLANDNENNKLTYWMATGSGKTVIMKANIIDYFEWLRDKNSDEIEVIITSPLKELIGQLQKEMSDFFSHPFFKDFKFSYKIETTQGLISRYKNESHEIIGENQYRLLLVDEAHIGLGNAKKADVGEFVKLRNELTENITNSFMFEYSATFYDVDNIEQKKEYANRIIYEYDYGKFYNDKYGKDFKFGIVKKDSIAENEDKDIKRNLDENIKEFKKKIDAFTDYNLSHKRKHFQNRPLLIMAGNTVSKVVSKDEKGNVLKQKNGKEKTENSDESSDIAKIIAYLADLDENVKNNNLKIFNENKGVLHLLQSSNVDGEVLISFGEDCIPFGLITIGDVKKFLENINIQNLINEGKIISKTMKFPDENYLFKNIDFETSPINILIGSRKFSAGWNSFRASQICLINFGTGSGPTIIQMFGRGVRLKGLNNDGKRVEQYYVKEDEDSQLKSEFISYDKPNKSSREEYELLKYLETLFIFSLRSTYLSKFVEEDTDIYKKSISFTKKVEVSRKIKEQRFPIFKVNKDFKVIDEDIVCTLSVIKNDTKHFLDIEYNIDNKTTFDLPLALNMVILEDKILRYDDYKLFIDFIDKAYLQSYLLKKLSKNRLEIEQLDIKFILDLLEKNFIFIKYDGDISSPKQIQKLFIKIIDTVISKIKNRIIYNENRQNYHYNTQVSSEDLIDKYDVKFVLEKEANMEAVQKELEKDDSYKIFIDKISNHFYQPLALNPDTKTKETYKTYEECLDKRFTQNFVTLKEFGTEYGYFKNIESIQISPDKMDGYEFKFVCDMQKYIDEQDLDAILLRNKSKGNIGLIGDEGVFYPDFIVWYKDNNNQEHIIFCDPKGIRNTETKWKVCEVPYYIKEVEKDFSKNIKLHSFIISNTLKEDVKWGPICNLSSEQCDVFFNLVFFGNKNNYVKRIFDGINEDILIHKDFMKYIEYYDDDIINEWLDSDKRKIHLENINELKASSNTELSKLILAYFLIYNQKDLLKEEIIDDTKEEVKSYFIEEILPEGVNAFLPGAKIVYKIAQYTWKKYNRK